MKVGVTGGAGYIGAHVVRMLLDRGDEVVIFDDLSTGYQSRIVELPIQRVDVTRAPMRDMTLALRGCNAVIHLAAKKRVDESVAHPAMYFQQNVGGVAAMLEATDRASVGAFVFSSSAAVYGDTAARPIRETARTLPLSPYGVTKLIGEQLVGLAATASGLAATSLRYFNVAGAASPELADRVATNLIPIAVRNALIGVPTVIFGDDYATSDGTCVRDYVHVVDLARAHVEALDYLFRVPPKSHRVYNVGTGAGHSVLEVVDEVHRLVPGSPAPVVSSRRPGDPATVVADSSRLRSEVGWQAQYGLDSIIRSSVDALKQLIANERR